MPIELSINDGIIHTILVGRVTDEELLSHYAHPVFQQYDGLWREVVDGRKITEMEVTPNGQRKLASFVASHAERLRGGRVAMVASDDVTYGMFRMWEMQREGLGYDVQVFREMQPALDWVIRSSGGKVQKTAKS